MKKISILGSTGSIGQTTLSIVEDFPDQFDVVALAAGQNTTRLMEQIQAFSPSLVSVATEAARKELLEMGANVDIEVGVEGAKNVAAHPEADLVMSAIVGASGLIPTLHAIEHGKEVLLANKESMVVSGALMAKKIQEHQARLRPVDSEHSAIFQSIQGVDASDIQKVILTASGGPFFFQKDARFEDITVEQALKHPNWDMGAKITIDSATMMNKGLEVIEAKWLFDLSLDQIDVVVHPQSIVHSFVELTDGSTLSQLGVPHMRGPVAYAMSYPKRLPGVIKAVDFAAQEKLDFHAPDAKRYPSIPMAYEALKSGPTYPAVLNGANEQAVDAFLQRKITFQGIFDVLNTTLDAYQEKSADTLDDYICADQWGRAKAKEVIENQSN